MGLKDLVSDDTQFLQDLLDVGGNIVLQPRFYKVNRTIDPIASPAALYMKENTSLDLNGSTIFLKPGQDCSLIGRRDQVDGGGAPIITNIEIKNGTLIGNGSNQSRVFRDFLPTVYLRECDQLQFRDLIFRDSYLHTIFARGDDAITENIVITDAIGGGLHLTGDNWTIGDSTITNVSFFDSRFTKGNPFIASITNSSVGDIICNNFVFGVKFQNGCDNVTVGNIVAIAGQNNADDEDFLVKFQGTEDALPVPLPCNNMTIASIVAENGPLSGLQMFFSTNINIGSYTGTNNCNSTNFSPPIGVLSDFLNELSDDITIDVFRASGFPIHAIWLNPGSGTVISPDFVVGGPVEPTVNVVEGVAILNGVSYFP